MNNQEKLINILSSYKPEIDINMLKSDTKLEDLNIESLTFIEIIFDIESEFGIEIPDDKLGDLKTIGDFFRCIEKKKEELALEKK